MLIDQRKQSLVIHGIVWIGGESGITIYMMIMMINLVLIPIQATLPVLIACGIVMSVPRVSREKE